jgi:hypothetical protein
MPSVVVPSTKEPMVMVDYRVIVERVDPVETVQRTVVPVPRFPSGMRSL